MGKLLRVTLLGTILIFAFLDYAVPPIVMLGSAILLGIYAAAWKTK